MAEDASAALGAPQVAGTLVNPKGLTKSGALKMEVTDEVLARVPRSDIASCELDQGTLLSKLRIVFGNGVTWEFDIPRQAKQTAQGLVTALGGQLT